MSHSYASNRIHLIFSTKGREKRIPVAIQEKLWPYMAGIARNHGFQGIKVGGVQDHVHVLLLLPATIPLAKAVQILKWRALISPGRRVTEPSASARPIRKAY